MKSLCNPRIWSCALGTSQFHKAEAWIVVCSEGSNPKEGGVGPVE